MKFSFLQSFRTSSGALYMSGTNFLHLLFCKFCMWVSFTRKTPSLFHHVINVISRCSKEQMLRIYTPWIITCMENVEICRYRTNEKNIGYPMRRSFSFLANVKMASAITIFIAYATPFPTRDTSIISPVANRNVSRESFKWCLHKANIIRPIWEFV